MDLTDIVDIDKGVVEYEATWTLDTSPPGCGFFCLQWEIASPDARILTLDLGYGVREHFEFTADAFFGASLHQAEYTALTTPGATLILLNGWGVGNTLSLQGGELIDVGASVQPYDPDAYQIQYPDGTIMNVSVEDGLEYLQDPHGNFMRSRPRGSPRRAGGTSSSRATRRRI